MFKKIWGPQMTIEQERRASQGFTLVEIIVVLAVLAILAGTAMPLVSHFIDRQREDEVRREFADLAESLEDYYFDHGSFPESLRAEDFYALYLQPGFAGTAVTDSWGDAGDYVYRRYRNPDIVKINSVGVNGRDEEGQGDDLAISVHGSVAGYRKTRSRMRIVIEVLANYLEAGGRLQGDWPTDRKNMGLSDSFALDGFGTPFTLDGKSYALRSAGPDRKFGTADDLSY